MLLSNKFCSSFITSLKDNKPFLKESSLRLLEESITNYKRVMLYELSFNFDTSLIELKIGRDLIINNIDDHDYPKFGYREMGFSDSLPIKELIFKDAINPTRNWFKNIDYLQTYERKNLEIECMEELVFEKKISYDRVSNFSCFNKNNELIKTNYMNDELLEYNSSGWIEYIFNLVTLNFPEFIFSEIKLMNVTRFVKKINNELFFAIEYDKSKLLKEIGEGQFDLPRFDLIIFNSNFDLNTSRIEYVNCTHPNALYVGRLSSPFFFPPCFPQANFMLIELGHNRNNFSVTNPSYKYKREPFDNKRWINKFKYINEYGEKLKQHAFFYMNLLSCSSKSYLEYIEKSVIESV